MGSHLSVLDASGPEGSRKRNFPGSIPTVLNQRESAPNGPLAAAARRWRRNGAPSCADPKEEARLIQRS